MVWLALKKHTPFVCISLVLTSAAMAEPARVSVSTGLEYSDNVGKDANNTREDVSSITEFDVTQKLSKGPLTADLNIAATYQNYLGNSFKSYFLTESTLDTTYQFNKQFSWMLEDQLSDVPEDSSKADTPENLVRLNVFKTGPKYTRYWNKRNFTELAAYFIDVSYEGRQIDSQRARGIASQNWLHAGLFQSGLQAEVESARIDDAEQTKTDIGSLAFLISKSFRYGKWGGRLGGASLTRKDNANSEVTDEDWTGQFNFDFKITGKSDFAFEVGHEFTDSASDKVLTGFDELRALRAVDAVKQNRVKGSLDYDLSKRDRFTISLRSFSEKYQDQDYTEKSRNFNLRWLHWHTPRMQSGLNFTRQVNQFSNSGVTKKLWRSGYSLAYFFMKNVSLAAYLRYEDTVFNVKGSDYDELATGLTMTWTSGK